MPPKLNIKIGATVDDASELAKSGARIAADGKTSSLEQVDTVMAAELIIPSTGIHIFHRQPDPAVTDRRSPRSVCLEDVMAIEPMALERAFFPSFWDDDTKQREYDVENGVAILTIDGPLMQKGGWWWEGYDCILSKFDDALADAEVEAVVLKINSPGGVCSGCFSSARSMIALKKEAGKPVYAFADESAYSAAYALACVADDIYLPREGGVGSVGVIGVLEDYSAYNDKLGIKVAVLTSGSHKADGHPDVPLKPDVIARYQARITQLGGYFAEHVAMARGMTTESVLALQADCLYGDAAVSAGLANGVKSFEDVMVLATGKASARIAARGPAVPTYGATDKNTRISNAKAAAAAHAPPQESPMTMISLAAVALAIGLGHDATEADVQAGIGKMKTDASKNAEAAEIAKKDLVTVLDAHGAKSPAEAIGKLEAERSSLDELVKAVVGSDTTDGKASTAADALKKLAADRHANEESRAKRLIEEAAAAGKTAGEKAMGIFERHGMAALEAHIDALVPHAAIVTPAPKQKDEKGAASPTKPVEEATLSEDDKILCETYGIDEKAFLATRARELAEKKKNEEYRNS